MSKPKTVLNFNRESFPVIINFEKKSYIITARKGLQMIGIKDIDKIQTIENIKEKSLTYD